MSEHDNMCLWPNGPPQRHEWGRVPGLYVTAAQLRAIQSPDAYQQWWSWHCTMLSEIRKSGEQEQRNHANHKG